MTTHVFPPNRTHLVVLGTAFPSLRGSHERDPDPETVAGGQEPQDGVCKVDPYGAHHAPLAVLFWRRRVFEEELAEDGEEAYIQRTEPVSMFLYL